MKKGWFRIPGVQEGDRSLEDQLKGLAPMLAEVRGKRVLDLGCAEGLILRECMKAGASAGYGVEHNAGFVARANRELAGSNARVVQCDLNGSLEAIQGEVDVILALAILHKLRDPFRLVDAMKREAPDLIVIRTPAVTPGFVKDPRSANLKFDVVGRLADTYALERVERGHFDEWVGYFRHYLAGE